MSTEPKDRLRLARIRAGFPTAADAARRFGWNQTTYGKHENGERKILPDVAKKYAKAFRVSAAWILYDDSAPAPVLDPLELKHIERLRSLTDRQKSVVFSLCDALSSEPPP